ncbi:hypothetical protein Taro_010777 [Colocasia esculenta]|uniref:Uncharacterized protein n=1 Tax=Colocasia esculenta TaxID=4460 RepID=A0A843U8F7_COLES|nr:hypothetical protein [Colocasia esculenta]
MLMLRWIIWNAATSWKTTNSGLGFYVIRMVDGDDKNGMRYHYEAMDHAKLELQQSLPREYQK